MLDRRRIVAMTIALSITCLLGCEEGRHITINDSGGSDTGGSSANGSGGVGGLGAGVAGGSPGAGGRAGSGGAPGADAGGDRNDAGDDALIARDARGDSGSGGGDLRDGSGDANPDTPSTCPVGQKLCGGFCILTGSCCVRGDCAGACTDCLNGACAAIVNRDDSDLGRCAGTCDATGACRSRKGQLCNTVPGNCVSGTFCSPDGTCCDRACNGPCEACDIQGYQGICTPVALGGSPHSNHAACVGAGSPCGGSCAGLASGLCQYPASACGAAACVANGSSVGAASCSAGACVAPAPRSCAPYLCSTATGVCPTTCSSGADCVAGYACVASSCVCGGSQQPCCGGSACNTGFACAGGDAGLICHACGAAGQPCCASSTCNAGLTCNSADHLCIGATLDAAAG